MYKLLSAILLTATCLGAEAQRQFWGTTSSGGQYENGFIFKTDSIGDNLEIVHHFKNEIDGSNIGALLLASNNKLYGLAASGGQGGSNSVFSSGTLFEYDLNTDQFRVIEHLGPLSTNLPNIFTPRAEGVRGLTEVSPGLIYGLARQGKYVFSYNFNTGVFDKPFVLPTYQGGPTNSTMQNQIAEAFYKATDGNLYACTTTNSSCPVANPYMGSIIRVIPSTNALAIRYRSVCLVDNGYTYNGHFAEANGKLYGTTNNGGTSNQGVIFEYIPSSNTYSKRHDFHGGVLTNSFYPTSLVFAKNGKLYGTAHGGGVPEQNLASGGGILYEFDLITNTFTKKHDFLLGIGWLGDVGTFPSSLVISGNGKLYGCTEFGVFEYNTTTSELRMAGRFWTRGFAPSMLQVCRKPSYQHQTVTTHEVCKDAAFTLDLASPNATTIVWKHNNVTDASRTTSTLSFETFTAADAGTWVCTLTNKCGSTTSQTFTLVMNNPPQPVITPGGPATFCSGETITLIAPEGFASYTWSTGETSREIIISESGDYTVSVNNGCESPLSQPVTVTVLELPSAPTHIESTAYNKLKAVGSTTRYKWTFNGTLLSDQTAEITVTETGVYEVRSVSDKGCRSEDFASLSFVVTGLEAAGKEQLAIYPNPSRGIVNVRVRKELIGPVEVSLYNTSGQLVIKRSIHFNRDENTISFGQLPAGIYRLLLRKESKLISANVVIR
jgi:uncharacterized repeat protein (TIGR03803 family)